MELRLSLGMHGSCVERQAVRTLMIKHSLKPYIPAMHETYNSEGQTKACDSYCDVCHSFPRIFVSVNTRQL